MSSDFHEAFVPLEDTWLCRIGEFVYVLDWNGVSISTIAAVISSPLDCLSTWKKSRVRCGGEFITYIMSEVVDCSWRSQACWIWGHVCNCYCHVIITYIFLRLRLKVIFLNLVGLKSNVLMF